MAALALLAAASLLVSFRLLANIRAHTRPAPEQVPICPTRPGVPLDELMSEATVLSCDIQIVEVIALDDEIVVGTTGGIFHLYLPWPFARRQALDRLHLWRISSQRLTAFHAPRHGLSGLADEGTGNFLCTPIGA